MEYQYLGRTGMKVSRLCLGTMNLGTFASEKESFEILDRALDAGINFIDTANVYGRDGDPKVTNTRNGLAEELLGKWFALGGGRRERVVLATKAYNPMADELDGPNNCAGLSTYKLRRHIEGSLKRLQTDHLELFLMHHVDERTTWEELWGTFEPMVNDGTVDYIGSSNFGARHLCYAQAAADKRNFLGLVCEEHRYSLNCRLPELELMPAAKDLGIGVLPWSPLSGGLLSGNVIGAEPGTRRYKANKRMTDQQRVQVAAYEELCKDLGESGSCVAIAWTLANPSVTSTLIGPRTPEQLDELLHAVELKLDEDVMKKLDTIFPGPGGSAPKAYAW